MGKISELIQGRDERVRSAKVTVAPHKVLHRALNMLYPLECYDPIDSQVDKPTSIPETENNCDDKNEGDDVLYHTRIYTIRVWYIPYAYTHMV